MKFTKRLTIYCITGLIIWFAASVGVGLYFRPAIVLCGWPVFLLHKLLPERVPGVYEIASPMLCLISLISWVGLAALLAAVTHWVVRRPKSPNYDVS
jgi:hypothetical protein